MIDLPTVITALATLLLAGGTVMSQRSTRRQREHGEFRDDLEDRDAQMLAARRYMRTLEDRLVDKLAPGERMPARPAELAPGWTKQKRRKTGQQEVTADGSQDDSQEQDATAE